MLREREFHNFLIYRIIRDNVYDIAWGNRGDYGRHTGNVKRLVAWCEEGSMPRIEGERWGGISSHMCPQSCGQVHTGYRPDCAPCPSRSRCSPPGPLSLRRLGGGAGRARARQPLYCELSVERV